MRKKLWEMVRTKQGKEIKITGYDMFMIIIILISIIPLCFKNKDYLPLQIIEKVTVVFFVLDYIARWVTADFKYRFRQKWKAFLYYPITPYAIVDFLAMLPSLGVVSSNAATILSLLRAVRIFKVLRYSKSFDVTIRVFRKEKKTLMSVFGLAIGYIIISALVLYQVEPGTFKNLFEAFYWATTELTTVGYGDIYPKENLGRLVGMFSSFVGIAVVALPAGIITAGYMTELTEAQAAKAEAERKMKEMEAELLKQQKLEEEKRARLRAKRKRQAAARKRRALEQKKAHSPKDDDHESKDRSNR